LKIEKFLLLWQITGNLWFATEEMESGMTPCGKHGNRLFLYLPLGKRHLEQVMPENGFTHLPPF